MSYPISTNELPHLSRFPETLIDAIKRMALCGFAVVEVNGKMGIVFNMLTGSGQGDPISSILLLIATEPLNLEIVQKASMNIILIISPY